MKIALKLGFFGSVEIIPVPLSGSCEGALLSPNFNPLFYVFPHINGNASRGEPRRGGEHPWPHLNLLWVVFMISTEQIFHSLIYVR
jgi:hypothetical protein